jgi:drug/metabolite transporter (DMT)-like permease
MPGTSHRAVRLVLIAVFGGPIFLASMNLAVSHVGATVASFVAGLYAVLAAALAPLLLPEGLTRRVLGGLVLALAGTALLAELDPASADRAGLAWGLLAAVSFALYLLLGRRWSRSNGLEGTTIALATLAVSTVSLGTLVLLGDPASLVPTRLDVVPTAAIGWLAVVAVAGQLLTVASVRLVPAARTAAFLLLNPITATVLAAILVGERPSALQLVGGGLVLAGIAAATVPVPGRSGPGTPEVERSGT